MRKFNTALLLTLFLFALNSGAEAKIFSNDKKVKTPEQKPVVSQEKKSMNYIDRLNLTQEQKDFYQQIRRNEYEQLSPIVDKIKLKHQELEKLMASDMPPMAYEFEENAIKQDLRKFQEEIKAVKLQNEEKIEAILTPEQKAEYKKLKAESFNIPVRKTPSRSLGSVSTTKEFVYTPCEGTNGAPACKIDDLLKKQPVSEKK